MRGRGRLPAAAVRTREHSDSVIYILSCWDTTSYIGFQSMFVDATIGSQLAFTLALVIL